jgi:hypothetical protein
MVSAVDPLRPLTRFSRPVIETFQFFFKVWSALADTIRACLP